MKAPDTPASLPEVPLWVDGRCVSVRGPGRGEIRNPATGRVVRRVGFAGVEEVQAAVDAASRAAPAWRALTPLGRARIFGRFLNLMQDNREALARLISEEHGKTVADDLGSIQ